MTLRVVSYGGGVQPTALLVLAAQGHIDLDEAHRANPTRCEPHETLVYPLLDLRHRRTDCLRITHQAGLPPPPGPAERRQPPPPTTKDTTRKTRK
jgi:hypothetical protein